MNALVLGGTRYFGKRLVELLLNEGHVVTVASRRPASFEKYIEHRTLDRGDPSALASLAAQKPWDFVFDQICYSPDDAISACKAFKGRVGRYIHTSTASVYNTAGVRPESDFDPFHYTLGFGPRTAYTYGEGKRLAEAVFFQKAEFPVAAMRIPIVLGPDDYTGRLEFHIDRVRRALPIVVPNLEAETSFILSSEAARFLYWLSRQDFTGPINACSDGGISISEVLRIVESHVGKKANVVSTGPDSDHTPFTDDKTRRLDTQRARALGFAFEPLASWFEPLVTEISNRQNQN